MFATPGMRAFSLAARRGDGGVSLDADGVFVGDVPPLKRSKACGANGGWAVRPIEDINHELTALYRLPIDAASKANALVPPKPPSPPPRPHGASGDGARPPIL
jgi:hypothetical protein